MKKDEMSPQAAALVLRMFEGMITTACSMDKDNRSEMMGTIVDQLHDAVDLACTALVLMGDNSIEIDGGKNDG